MRKLYSSFLLLLALLFIPQSGLAHPFDTQKKDVQLVLFGRDNYYASQPKDQRNAIVALAYAQNLVLDEFNGNSNSVFGERLQFLKEYGVHGLPSSTADIDFTCNSGHETYVNIRWENGKVPDRGNWPIRKNILLSTVNRVFNFGIGTDIYLFSNEPVLSYTEQCNAFAALLFYLHQIGDIQTTTYKATVFPLARAHPGDSNPDILWDLMEIYLPQLFPGQTNSDEYRNLISELQDVAVDVRSLVGSTGGINSTDKQEQYKGYASRVKEILSEHIPKLLHNESFFTEVFPEI